LLEESVVCWFKQVQVEETGSSRFRQRRLAQTGSDWFKTGSSRFKSVGVDLTERDLVIDVVDVVDFF
jgi:hypothetical protein